MFFVTIPWTAMRLWSLHPKYLDTAGLVALWREALLAKKVLQGKTRGYRHHPQLQRFREATEPVRAINAYLAGIRHEACRRGYAFDARKHAGRKRFRRIGVSAGQLGFEFLHLKKKLRRRDLGRYRTLLRVRRPEPHPLFRQHRGPIAAWERGV
ncbi:MAG: hypothetical protein HBSIN02_08600 [Bacteroidia bacterium]|nr:MAG: hypothetical protein HBSIN02_08600 [Bacteroidia bacterium]